MRHSIKATLLSFAFVACAADSCDTANRIEGEKVDQQQTRYLANQPPPAFDWSMERYIYAELYKQRNAAVHTYSYVINQFTGKIIRQCASIGFPISAATQLTNPLTVRNSTAVVAQAEPNGLFTPSTSRGTWVMCLAEDGNIQPEYWEADVAATVRPMQEDPARPGQLVPVPGTRPSISVAIKTSR